MRYRAVIFDMDGVLIDSESFYIKRIYKGLSEKYPQIRMEDLYPTVGMDQEREWQLMERLTGRSREDTGFRMEIEKIHADAGIPDFREVLYPEVPETLERLRKMGLILALASSSPLREIKRALSQCGLTEYFASVISGEQFQESKPNPAIYRITMERIGCCPEECLVVEDSTYGVEAGAAAGAAVAARLDGRFPFDQSKASYYIHTLEEVLEIIKGGRSK